jgi:hypothetical protein
MKNGEVIGKGISDYIDQSTPVIENNEVVKEYASVYPNPFNSTTNIKFILKKRDNISILIYDINGREVSKEEAGPLNTGTYNYNFSAVNLPSGIYFYTINSIDGIVIFRGKFALVK